MTNGLRSQPRKEDGLRETRINFQSRSGNVRCRDALGGGAAAYELTVPSFAYRTGPFAPGGIPFANGYSDYFQLLNERDGGINGTWINLIECETAYDTKLGVECYENLKDQGESGAVVLQPLSTGITYQLIRKRRWTRFPCFQWDTAGPLRSMAQCSLGVQFSGDLLGSSLRVRYVYWRAEGGMDQLAGKKIALVYLNGAYGKEPIPTLEALSAKHGFEFLKLAVDAPGREQKATWLQIRKERPDWVLLWGWAR